MTFNGYSITTWINITICNFVFNCHPYFLVTIYEEFLTINSDCDKKKNQTPHLKHKKNPYWSVLSHSIATYYNKTEQY